MHLRETLSEKPWVGVTMGAAMLAMAGVCIAYQMRDTTPQASKLAFYTTDDGATWFKDSADLVPPFQHQGKTAVRAYVFRCGGKESVHYLRRYTEDTRKRIAEAQSRGPEAVSGATQAAVMSGAVQIKKPGDAKWVSINSKNARNIVTVKCPEGSTPVAVDP